VDDDKNIGLIVRLTLQRHGHQVSCVQTGEDALSACRQKPPELVVLDIGLPGMDGFEVCRRLKADPSTAAVPVVFLSADTSHAEKLRGAELGAAGFIQKPFEPELLVRRLQELVRPSR